MCLNKRHIAIFLILLVCSLSLFCKRGNAVPIDRAFAETIIENFLDHLGAAASNHQLTAAEEIFFDGEQVGFRATLSPQGYILVSADTIRIPVKAYSLTSSFSSLPPAYTENLLRELSLPDVAQKTAAMGTTAETTNEIFWQFLTFSQPAMMLESYVPDTYLLTTKWDQNFPYNAFNPLVGDQRTLTGCTQTAVAQVMDYHQHPQQGNGIYDHSWNGQTLTSIMNRPFNWDMLSDTPHTSSDLAEQEEIAALMLDLGILNRANFGTASTSAAFRSTNFRQAFGYAPIYSMDSSPSFTTFFETIRSEIDNLRPVLLSIPGHMTVADGYASDGAGRKIHVNMGWSGHYDDYYFLDETIVAGGYSFPSDHTIYYNIKPCSEAECLTPDPPLGNYQEPEFMHLPADIAVNSNQQVRIDARDPDGDTVALSAYSSCSPDQIPFTQNLLTIAPTADDSYCQYTVFASSQDGSSAATFKVLTGPTDIYKGEQFDISDQFADQTEVDEYLVFLSGETSISGYRGYSNQAFYIWIEDDQGSTIVASSDDTINATFSPGYYSLFVSLQSPGGSYYYYNTDYSNYIVSVSVGAALDDIAAYDDLALSDCQMTIEKAGDGTGTVLSIPGAIDCGPACTETFVCDSYMKFFANEESTSLFTGWSGDCSGADPLLLHRIQGDTSCTATFAADGDTDGMPDAWETQYGLDTASDDSAEDNDGDGVNNITEYQNGTPPIVLQGDVNGDDVFSIADTILCLKVASGNLPVGVRVEADINGDLQIGIAEAIYSLKKSAGL